MKGCKMFAGVIPDVEVVKESGKALISFGFEKKSIETEEEGTVEQLCYTYVESEPEYSKVVSAIVRERYSQDAVEAIVLNGDKTPEHAAELNELNEYRAYAKEVAVKVVELWEVQQEV